MSIYNAKLNYYGFNPPFFGGSAGILSRQENERLIKNDLLQLLLTLPGERVMLPTFGTALRSFVFEQFDDATLEMLRMNIINAISLNEGRVNLTSLTLSPDYDNHGLRISITFSLKAQPNEAYSLDTFIANGDNNV